MKLALKLASKLVEPVVVSLCSAVHKTESHQCLRRFVGNRATYLSFISNRTKRTPLHLSVFRINLIGPHRSVSSPESLARKTPCIDWLSLSSSMAGVGGITRLGFTQSEVISRSLGNLWSNSGCFLILPTAIYLRIQFSQICKLITTPPSVFQLPKLY